jgi:hypothetical protein
VVVEMIPIVLGELYLFLSLRGDEENICGHQKKKKEVLGDGSRRKSSTSTLI